MGYGDMFIAAAFGGLVASELGRSAQLRAALLVGVLAVLFDLLFFAVDELPATVPVAIALVLIALTRRRREGARAPRGKPASAAARARPLRHPLSP